MKSKVLLLGYGEMGHAMEYLLTSTHDVSIWDPYCTYKLPSIDLKRAVSDSDCIVFCTPAEPIFQLTQQIARSLPKHCPCLSMAKALDSQGRTVIDALQQGLVGRIGFGVLYGPMISEEIRAGKPAFACVAGSDEIVVSKAVAVFRETGLKLKPLKDMKGAAWCAVLKNVYSILFGIADELDLGDNMRGFLAVATLHEMASLVQSMGCSPDTPYSLAGLGDLFTTATSEDSHHHQLGRMVAREERDNLTGEGINTLDAIVRLKLVDRKKFPLLNSVWKILREPCNPGLELWRCIDTYL